MSMHTPELLLKDLNSALRELRGAASMLDEGKIDAALLPAMRRLLLAEVLGNTGLIAIGGSQGAGKTTLLCTLYGLGSDERKWLDPNEGRGEKLPVLVCEEAGRSHAQGAVRRLREVDGHYMVAEDEVSLAYFQKAIADPDPEVLLPVLKVPPRYFQRGNFGFLLLPGYEKQNRQNEAWQQLMRQALVGATGCIVVTDETRMANMQQLEIVKDMLSNELRGAQVVVAISKTEADRGKPERLQELRSTAQKIFEIEDEVASRRVICCGSDASDYVAEWLPSLTSAITDLAISGGGDRKVQLSRLEDVLKADLTNVLTQIRSKAMIFFMQREGGEGMEVLKACLEAFDDSRAELRARYQEAIAAALDEQHSTAWDELQNRLKSDHEGLWNKIKSSLDTVTETQLQIEDDVSDAWKQPGPVLERYAMAIAGVTGEQLKPPQIVPLPDKSKATPLQQLGYVDAENHPVKWLRPNEEDQKNLQILFAGNATSNTSQPLRATEGFERAVELLPALTLEYARAASLMPNLVGVDSSSLEVESDIDRSKIIKDSVDNLGTGVKLGETVFRSIATVLAIDGISDGDIDIVGPVLRDGAGAAALGGIGGAVVGIVAIGYLANSAMKEVRCHDSKVRVLAREMLMNIKDSHYQHFMRHFDDLMERVRVHLNKKLRERYHLSDLLMEQDRLAVAIAKVRTLQRDLLGELGRSGHTVMLFNAEEAGA